MKTIEKGGIKMLIEAVVVVGLYAKEFAGKMTASAHLSQKRVTTYPAKRMDTGFAAGLFDSPVGETFETIRHTLVPIPADADVEIVAKQLANFEDSCIHRILSNDLNEVISDKEKSAIANGLITLNSLAPRYVVRNGDGNVYANVTTDGEILTGDARVVGKVVETEEGDSLEITNPNALLEYKRDIYSREWKEDIDNRVKVNVTTKVEVLQSELTA